MSYVFHNLSDEKLDELTSALYEERKRRFLLTVDKYPKLLLSQYEAASAVDGVKAYRAAYNLSLSHAHSLFNHYHR